MMHVCVCVLGSLGRPSSYVCSLQPPSPCANHPSHHRDDTHTKNSLIGAKKESTDKKLTLINSTIDHGNILLPLRPLRSSNADAASGRRWKINQLIHLCQCTSDAQHMFKCGTSAGLTGSWQDTDESVWTVKALP